MRQWLFALFVFHFVLAIVGCACESVLACGKVWVGVGCSLEVAWEDVLFFCHVPASKIII